ncbi:MAG: hypothetical protein ACYCPQ_06810 [Elusimicrobiota bacterium]
MTVKRAVLMTSAFGFFLGLSGALSCMGGMGGAGGQCGGCMGTGSSSGSGPQLTQAQINQCTQQNTVPCLSQMSCQYVCSNNPNMPGGAGQPCPAGQ